MRAMDAPRSPEPASTAPATRRPAGRRRGVNQGLAVTGIAVGALGLVAGSTAVGAADRPAASVAAYGSPTPVIGPTGQAPAGVVSGPVPHVGAGLASVGKPAVGASTVGESVTCPSADTAGCKIRLTLIVVETITNGKVTAVTAVAKPNRHKRTVRVGRTTLTVGPGDTTRARVKLNTTGKRLLATRGKLTARLVTAQATTGGGSVVLTRHHVKFKPAVKKH